MNKITRAAYSLGPTLRRPCKYSSAAAESALGAASARLSGTRHQCIELEATVEQQSIRLSASIPEGAHLGVLVLLEAPGSFVDANNLKSLLAD